MIGAGSLIGAGSMTSGLRGSMIGAGSMTGARGNSPSVGRGRGILGTSNNFILSYLFMLILFDSNRKKFNVTGNFKCTFDHCRHA